MSEHDPVYYEAWWREQKTPTVDPSLYEHATDRRKLMLRLIEEKETMGEVGDAMGIKARSVYTAFDKLSQSAARARIEVAQTVAAEEPSLASPENPVRILCIGDLHAHPDYDNDRFDVLGQYVVEVKPDIIVQIGDWADVVSLNSHGSKLELEGVRWKQDVAVTQDSLARFNAPIEAAGLRPEKHLITGNHEARIHRFVAQNPHLQGVMGIDDLGFEEHGWTVHRFGEFINIAGFRFVHHMTGKTGRAAALGTNFKKRGVSVVVGHSHTASHFTEYHEGRRIHGIDLGCAVHPAMGFQESWSCPNAHSYWRGVFLLDNALDGDADISRIRAETLGF